METTDIAARILEAKSLIRRVRTPGGAKYFGQPIGSIIVADGIGGGRRRKRQDGTGGSSRSGAASDSASRASTPESGTQQSGAERREERSVSDLAPLRMDMTLNEDYVEALAEQIRRDGVGDNAVMVQETRTDPLIFDGHHFLAAAERAGLDKVPVRVFDSSDAGILAGTRALNQAERDKETGRTRIEGEPFDSARNFAIAPLPTNDVDLTKTKHWSEVPDANRSLEASEYTMEHAPLYQNSPPAIDLLDEEFLKNGTLDEAYDRLANMGVEMYVTESFENDRDFFVSLAEMSRVMEEMFPGFIKRHGNFYTQEGSTKKKEGEQDYIAYNLSVHKRTHDTDYGPDPEHIEILRPSAAWTAGETAGRSVDNPLNSTITVFNLPVLKDGTNKRLGTTRMSTRFAGQGTTSNARKEMPWYSLNDGIHRLAEKSSVRMASMMSTMMHEFGHAITNSIDGSLATEFEGVEDPNLEKQRWYKEYHANAILDFLQDMNLAKRTGKTFDADYLLGIEKWRATMPNRNLPKIPDKDDATEEEWNAAFADWKRAWEANEPDQTRWQNEYYTWADDQNYVSFTRAGKASDNKMRFFEMLHADGYIERPNKRKFPQGNPFQGLVSDYAATKWVEMEAEMWASYMFDTEVTEATKRWGQVMHDMYSWYVEDDQ
jgi:hypothetical protein